jgi:transposase-like protein
MSKTTNKFSPEVRDRAVRLVLDNEGQHGSRWQAVMSISAKTGCAPQTLNEWVKKAEVDSGKRTGVSTDMAEKMKALSGRTASCVRQTRSFVRRARILRWRSSTAGRSDGRVHRRSAW